MSTPPPLPLTSAQPAPAPATVALLAVPFAPASANIAGAFQERIHPGAFAAQARDWRTASVRLLLQHEGSFLLATTSSGTLTVSSARTGVHATATLPRSLPYVAELVGRRDLSQCSIGFRAVRDEWGLENGIPVRTVLEARLFEISIVSAGTAAYEQTWCSTRAQARRRVDDLRGLLAEERAGKTLSAASREAIHAAIGHLQTLLDTADADAPNVDADTPPVDVDDDVPLPGTTDARNIADAQAARRARLDELDRRDVAQRLRSLHGDRRYPRDRHGRII